MRKLLELVIIIVFCVSMASGSTIMLISDSGYWPIGVPNYEFLDADGNEEFQDSPMVNFLEGLGYTVDTSGMAGEYRETTGWTTDQNKLDALNAADLIIVSRVTSSGSYDNDRKAWNELAVPILCQNTHILRSGGKWGWFNGSVARQSGGTLDMNIIMGHELVDGFGDPVTIFSSIPADPWNPNATSVWDLRTSVIGTYEDVSMLVDIPTGADFDVLCETTDYYGITGARRVYLGIYTYSNDYWSTGLTDDYQDLFAQVVDKTMNSTVKIANDLPAHDAADVSVYLANSENDLVFTILDSNVVEVDVYLGTEGDPNLISKSGYIIKHITPTTSGQYTVDLNTLTLPDALLEDGHLIWYTDYYWKVIGYEPNSITSIPELATSGPTWQFKTEPDEPIISGVSPSIRAAFVGDPNVVFSVSGVNIETYQWYKDGVATPLSNGSDYSGVDTDTLVINDIDESDVGFYYCVGARTLYDPVTSDPYGELQLKELKCHFQFNSDEVVGNITYDTISGVEAQLMGGATVEPDGVNSIIGGYLQLENPEATQYDTEYATILDGSGVADYPEITISAWVRQDTRDIGCVWDFGENQNNFFTFTTGYDDGVAKAQFEYQVEGSQKQGEYEVNFDRTGDWQFVAVTVDSVGDSKTYIDGEFKGSSNLRGNDVEEINLTAITKSLNHIGHRIYPNLPKFDGLIDELKIYNYVLSDVQIAQEYIDVMGGYVCTEEYDLEAYDYDHNCRVDLIDITEFASKWLENDRIYRP